MRPQGLEWQLMSLDSREPEHSRGHRVRKALSAFRVQSFYPTVPPKIPRGKQTFLKWPQTAQLSGQQVLQCSSFVEEESPSKSLSAALALAISRAQSARSVICSSGELDKRDFDRGLFFPSS